MIINNYTSNLKPIILILIFVCQFKLCVGEIITITSEIDIETNTTYGSDIVLYFTENGKFNISKDVVVTILGDIIINKESESIFNCETNSRVDLSNNKVLEQIIPQWFVKSSVWSNAIQDAVNTGFKKIFIPFRVKGYSMLKAVELADDVHIFGEVDETTNSKRSVLMSNISADSNLSSSEIFIAVGKSNITISNLCLDGLNPNLKSQAGVGNDNNTTLAYFRDCYNIILKNLELKNFASRVNNSEELEEYERYWHTLYLYNCKNAILKDIDMHHCHWEGIMLKDCKNSIVDGLNSHDNYWPNTDEIYISTPLGVVCSQDTPSLSSSSNNTIKNCIIDGSFGSMFNISGSNIVIKDCQLKNSGRFTIDLMDEKLGAEDILIENVNFDNTTFNDTAIYYCAIHAQNVRDLTIDSCSFNDKHVGLYSLGCSNIKMKNCSFTNFIKNPYFEDKLPCIAFFNDASTNCNFYKNNITNTNSYGVIIKKANNINISNNNFENINESSIRFIGSSNVKIGRNTFNNCDLNDYNKPYIIDEVFNGFNQTDELINKDIRISNNHFSCSILESEISLNNTEEVRYYGNNGTSQLTYLSEEYSTNINPEFSFCNETSTNFLNSSVYNNVFYSGNFIINDLATIQDYNNKKIIISACNQITIKPDIESSPNTNARFNFEINEMHAIIYSNPAILKSSDSQTRLSSYKKNDEEISIYPNPSSGSVNIKSSKPIKNVIIYDSFNRLIYSSGYNSINNIRIGLAEELSGIYFILVSDGVSIHSEKIIIF